MIGFTRHFDQPHPSHPSRPERRPPKPYVVLFCRDDRCTLCCSPDCGCPCHGEDDVRKVLQ